MLLLPALPVALPAACCCSCLKLLVCWLLLSVCDTDLPNSGSLPAGAAAVPLREFDAVLSLRCSAANCPLIGGAGHRALLLAILQQQHVQQLPPRHAGCGVAVAAVYRLHKTRVHKAAAVYSVCLKLRVPLILLPLGVWGQTAHGHMLCNVRITWHLLMCNFYLRPDAHVLTLTSTDAD